MLSWRLGYIDEVRAMSLQIPEFEDPYEADTYAERLDGRLHLIQIGQLHSKDAGFKVGYALAESVFYSWLGGVLPWARGAGLGQLLLEAQEAWVLEHGFRVIQVKSRNRFPAMMRVLLRNGYLISSCEDVGEGITSHRIHFEKQLGGA